MQCRSVFLKFSVLYLHIFLSLAVSCAGGSHRKGNSGKRVVPEDFEAEILSVRKASRREKGMAETEPRNITIKRLRGTPIGKWPNHEYARLRHTNVYVTTKAANCSAKFWTKYQEKIYVDIYAEATYRVAPMHHINFASMLSISQRLGRFVSNLVSSL
jgi:hypothetical protein